MLAFFSEHRRNLLLVFASKVILDFGISRDSLPYFCSRQLMYFEHRLPPSPPLPLSPPPPLPLNQEEGQVFGIGTTFVGEEVP
jgi:hypothetical protein